MLEPAYAYFVAEFLGISPKTLYTWTAEGRIPSYKFGRSVRLKLEELEAWASNQVRKGPELHHQAPRDPSGIDHIIVEARESVLSFNQGKARPASLKGGD